MERTKLGLSKDKMYKALGEGERTSKKVASIRMSDGSKFKRKNANQYGAAEGGNDYTEKRSNRTDRFDLGGTADSSNSGANMGGTMGSSIMKHGGGVIEEDDIVIVKSSKLKGRVTNKGTDFVTIEYIGKRPTGGDKRGSFKLSQLKLVSEYANGGGLADLPENPNNDAISYKRGGHVSKGELVWKKLSSSDKMNFLIKHFKTQITDRSKEDIVNKTYNFLPKNVKIKMESEYANVEDYANGGGLADVPESFPSNDAVSYGEGGGTKGYKLTLKSWDADVYEDDYNEGEGKNVNSFDEKVNKSFSNGEELLKYISDFVLYHPLKKEDYSIMDDGRIVTSVLVDEDNSSASAREVEEWKNGNKKLYSANYNFYVTLTQEKTPSADELSKLLGISVYKKGGRLSKYANGGSTKGFEYTIGGL